MFLCLIFDSTSASFLKLLSKVDSSASNRCSFLRATTFPLGILHSLSSVSFFINLQWRKSRRLSNKKARKVETGVDTYEERYHDYLFVVIFVGGGSVVVARGIVVIVYRYPRTSQLPRQEIVWQVNWGEVARFAQTSWDCTRKIIIGEIEVE